MKHSFIRVTEPSITEKEIQLVSKAVTKCWGKNAYYYIHLFEKKFAEYINVKHAIATSSCTGALHIALKALNIKKGDEVIIPDITWTATAYAVSYTGATPVFADILPDTWCIDPISIEKCITKRTKAIIPVHLYGHPADMDRIVTIAKKYKLYVVEDAAESIGAEYFGKKTGSIGDFGVFSFHGTKTLTMGEGGILLTNNSKLFKRANFIANMGKSTHRVFWCESIGLKYKLTDLQAALGLAQLSRVRELCKKKRMIYRWYTEEFSKIDGIVMNVEAKNCINSFWMPTIIWNKKCNKNKEDVMKELVKYNIDPRPFFYPLSQMPPYKTKVNNPVAYDISKRGINLPCGYSLTRDEFKYISEVIIKILYD